MAGQEGVERRPQAVDVAGRADLVPPALRLLRAHVLRRTQCRAGLRERQIGFGQTPGCPGLEGDRGFLGPIDRLGQAPIDDQRLAVGAQHDVRRLQVPVQHPAAVREIHRVADVEEMPQQLPQRQDPLARVAAGVLGLMELLDGLLEGLALDEPHGVIRAAVGVAAQAIDRDDPRVLQPAGDLGLAHEPGPALRAVGVACLHLLEGDLAAQLPVVGHEDLAQPAPGVELADLVPRARGRRRRRPPGAPAWSRDRHRRPPVGWAD